MIIVKHIPSWFPGASFQSRLRVTKSYVEDMKTIPFERVRVERVNLLSTSLYQVPTLIDHEEVRKSQAFINRKSFG